MAYARYNGTVQDLLGTAVKSATIWVYREGVGGLALIYSDRAGTLQASNPMTSGDDGSFSFHAPGGAYRFVILGSGLGTREMRYIPVGLGSESDIQGLRPMGAYNAGTTYELGDLVLSGDKLFASRVDANLNHTPDSTTPGDTTYWMYLGPVVGTTTSDVLDALGVHAITISESDPSGGVDGDLWLKVTP